jgi:hypothetical protein
MSRIVTTARAETRSSVASAANRASSTVPPKRMKTRIAGVVMIPPAIAAAIR